MAVPGEDGLYVLGCYERPATMHMQQCRAVNLLWALHAEGKLTEGMSLAVVGGGVGGLTTAAVALLLGCKVTLLEKHSNLLPIQRGNHTRFLHPNIYDWPNDRSEELQTNLPVLNWEAGLAGEVAEQLLKQWNEDFQELPDVTVHTECEVVGVKHDSGQLLLMCNLASGYNVVRCNHAILAVGLGIERLHEPLPFCSYWHDDNLHQPVLRKNRPRRYLVTGCGDGGLIDALRLQIDDFKHGDIHKLSKIVRNEEDLETIRSKLRDIEVTAGDLATRKLDVSAFLFEEYKQLNLSALLKEHEPRMRKDTVVHLHDRSSLTPLTLGASRLNRLMTFILVHYRGMKFHRGEVDWEQVAWEKGRGFRVAFKDGERIHTEYFDEIIVRHGPEPAIDEYFPGIRKKNLGKQLPPVDPTREPLWPDTFRTLLSEKLRLRKGEAVDRRASRADDYFKSFLGADADQGNMALEYLVKNSAENAQTVVRLLENVSVDWSRTHVRQVMHRFKVFCASCQQEAATLLTDKIKEARWPEGLFAAECFDYFTDSTVRTKAGNILAGALPKRGGVLLDHPDYARFTIGALGYLGAVNWSHVILRVLTETRSDSDQKFRSFALSAAGMLLAKAEEAELWSLHQLLSSLLYGFGKGEFSPSPSLVDDRELYWGVKRCAGRRKVADGADHFQQSLAAAERNSEDVLGLVRGTFAHVLGTLQLPHAIGALSDVLLRESAPKDLRIECARSLGRIRRREAAAALRDAIPILEQRLETGETRSDIANLARIALVCVAHMANDPVESLESVLNRWKPEYISPLVLRAIGLCGADKYLDRVRRSLESPDGEMRGQAGLALARMGHFEGLSDRLKTATSDLERVLFALAELVSGGRPDVSTLKSCLQNELFEWSGLVVEDLRKILSEASEDYKNVLTPWESLLDIEAENLSYLYG
jgi:hypothetical protein